MLRSGIDRRGLINAVDSNGKTQINATSNDILKIQRVDGSLLYDALDLSFNIADTTIISNINNIQNFESLNLRAVASNVFTKQETISNDIVYANALNDKADKSTSYTRTKIVALSETEYTFTAPLQREV